MILSDISTYLGHLHPLVVHLPIGFLLLAVIFQIIGYWPKWVFLRNAVSFTLLLGFISSVFACIFGYLLAGSGDYDYYQVNSHRNSGILIAVLSGLLYASTQRFISSKFQMPSKIFSLCLILLTGIMAYSGHQGAGLTHGSDYLNLEILTKQKRIIPDSVEAALIFEDVVQPILDSKCGSCHQGGKRKGGLTMQSWEALIKGGKTGPAVVAGNLKESELYHRITLNPTDEKFMPTDGKPALTAAETEIIAWWIEKANAVTGEKIASLKETGKIKPLIAYQLGLAEAPAAESNGSNGNIVVNPDIPETIEEGIIEKLRGKGWVVRILLQKPVMLDITLPSGSSISPATLSSDLSKIYQNIIRMNVSGNNLTEKDLSFLAGLTNLEKLRIEKNPIADGVFDLLVHLKHLEAVNLNETKISSAGLEKLKGNTSIKRVYCWGTAAADSTGIVVRE